MLFILFGFIFGILIYFYMQMSSIKEPIKNMQKINFIPSDAFNGARKGYIFKKDSKGLGYYLDNNHNLNN
jgi:hypothetical protein